MRASAAATERETRSSGLGSRKASDGRSFEPQVGDTIAHLRGHRRSRAPTANVRSSMADVPARAGVRQTTLKLVLPGTLCRNILQNAMNLSELEFLENTPRTNARQTLRTPTSQRRRRRLTSHRGTSRMKKIQNRKCEANCETQKYHDFVRGVVTFEIALKS